MAQHRGRALLVDALVVGWGLVRFRTLVPLTARAAGWRAAGSLRLPVPPEAVVPEYLRAPDAKPR